MQEVFRQRRATVMSEGRKQALSIRLGASDLRNLRKLARRLGVRHSDLVRFAIKSTLARLAPLHASDQKGRALVPVFVEAGADMVRYLDLNASDVDNIINEGAPAELRVEHEDVQLLAMAGMPHPYVRLHLVSVGGARVGGRAPAETDSAEPEQPVTQSLRNYLYDKYVYDGQRLGAAPAQTAEAPL